MRLSVAPSSVHSSLDIIRHSSVRRLHITNSVDAEENATIAVGVDTHRSATTQFALDHLGQALAELTFAATAAGYRELQRWAEELASGRELVFGIEGAGSWGAGLSDHLLRVGHVLLEVERPRHRDRRTAKSDRIDAIAAAKRVLSDENVSIARHRGVLTAIRAC